MQQLGRDARSRRSLYLDIRLECIHCISCADEKKYREQEITFIDTRWVISIFYFSFLLVCCRFCEETKESQNGESGELQTSKRSETEVLRIHVGLHEFFPTTRLSFGKGVRKTEETGQIWAQIQATVGVATICFHIISSLFLLFGAVSKEHVLDLSRVLRLTFILSADVFAFDGMRSHWTESRLRMAI